MSKLTQKQIDDAVRAATEAFENLKKAGEVKIYDSDRGHLLIAIA